MVDINKLKKNEEEFKKLYGDSHILDGITDTNIYDKTYPKILWILKEANDSSESSWDQRLFHKDVSNYSQWRRTYKLIIKITYAIFNNIKTINAIPDEYNIRDVLNNIAFINIKKKAGGSSASDKIIRDYYYRNRNLLLEQIEIINPNIIINCSRVWDLFIELTNSDIKRKNDFQYGKYKNRIIINAYHPNARYNNELYFRNIIEYIKDSE